jgi:hypothetical protein
MTYAQQATNGGPSKNNSACTTRACYEEVISPMDETLGLLPGHYLQVTVNGPALRMLLQKIPFPAEQKHWTAASGSQP